jgi:hypothetical protein
MSEHRSLSPKTRREIKNAKHPSQLKEAKRSFEITPLRSSPAAAIPAKQRKTRPIPVDKAKYFLDPPVVYLDEFTDQEYLNLAKGLALPLKQDFEHIPGVQTIREWLAERKNNFESIVFGKGLTRETKILVLCQVHNFGWPHITREVFLAENGQFCILVIRHFRGDARIQNITLSVLDDEDLLQLNAGDKEGLRCQLIIRLTAHTDSAIERLEEVIARLRGNGNIHRIRKYLRPARAASADKARKKPNGKK